MTRKTSPSAEEAVTVIAQPPAPVETGTTYLRFSLAQRFSHVIMLLSFTTLAVTGLVQKYASSDISVSIIRLLGGIDNTRVIHHVAATLLMLVTIYHLLEMGYKVFVLRSRMTMLPSLQDVRDAWMAFIYNIGLGKSRPQMGRYTFEEKAEYWALVWGTIVMGITGFLMWNPVDSLRFLPGEFVPAAKAAHGGEAVLAVLAIIVWHMYGVHLKRFNKSMWTGRLTEGEMLHEHPLELADIKAGVANRLPDPVTLRRRQAVYYPVAGILAIIMLASVYGFVNGEQTAIKTIPPQADQVPVYVPQTPTPLPTLPPTPTPLPTRTPSASASEGAPDASSTPTWDSYVGVLFNQKCSACHGTAATAGLTLTDYANAMKGGKDGPVIIPNDAANSKLFVIQSAGGHPGQLSADELDLIMLWINSGALEK